MPAKKPKPPAETYPLKLTEKQRESLTHATNGFMVDVRHAPREVQEIAFNKGLVPYIPADRQ